jgi:hypothetical protein
LYSYKGRSADIDSYVCPNLFDSPERAEFDAKVTAINWSIQAIKQPTAVIDGSTDRILAQNHPYKLLCQLPVEEYAPNYFSDPQQWFDLKSQLQQHQIATQHLVILDRFGNQIATTIQAQLIWLSQPVLVATFIVSDL